MEAGEFDKAIAAFTEDLEIHQRLGQPDQVGIVLEFLASVHERQGHLPRALEMYRQALGVLQQTPENEFSGS